MTLEERAFGRALIDKYKKTPMGPRRGSLASVWGKKAKSLRKPGLAKFRPISRSIAQQRGPILKGKKVGTALAKTRLSALAKHKKLIGAGVAGAAVGAGAALMAKKVMKRRALAKQKQRLSASNDVAAFMQDVLEDRIQFKKKTAR